MVAPISNGPAAICRLGRAPASECGLTGERYEGRCTSKRACRRPGARYWCVTTLASVANALTKEMLAERPQTLWRYREMLPVRRPENVVSLGEVVTPPVSLTARLRRQHRQGWQKSSSRNEGRLPLARSRRAA